MAALVKSTRSRLIAVTTLVAILCLAVGASIGASWTKSEVVPVVLVKPGIGGFQPIEGSSIGNVWPKSDVTPVLLVKPGIGGFQPSEGMVIGNTWSKQEVVAVALVEPSIGGFAPVQALSGRDAYVGVEPVPVPTPTYPMSGQPSSPAVIESKIDGDFEGWQGETILKLMNGQIWQQTEYFYRYHYAYMPKVLIFRSGGGYKMQVEGIDRAVGVVRLK